MTYIRFSVLHSESGSRLDRWIQRRWPEWSYHRIQSAIRQKKIRLNEKRSSCEKILRAGDHVFFFEPWFEDSSDQKSMQSKKEKISDKWLEKIQQIILYEDEQILVVNKPCDIATQGGTNQKISLDSVLKYFRYDESRPQDYIRLVHRLDKETSGVLLLAKTLHASQQLTQDFHDQKIDKCYWALTQGFFPQNEGEITYDIQDDDRLLPAKTYYRVLKVNHHYTWVELKPYTGRKHQLRIHLSLWGCPILGDRRYGSSVMTHMKLHCHAITLPGGFRIEAPLPPHFEEILCLHQQNV